MRSRPELRSFPFVLLGNRRHVWQLALTRPVGAVLLPERQKGGAMTKPSDPSGEKQEAAAKRLTRAPTPPTPVSGAGVTHKTAQAMDAARVARQKAITSAYQPPDWMVWRAVPDITKWEAVALSLDADPRSVSDVTQEFESRLLVLQRSHDLIQTARRWEPNGTPMVRTSEFAAWALSTGWKIPPELAVLGEATPAMEQTSTDRRWPWGDHNTKLLEHLAAAAEHFWKRYDADDPTTAPTNDDVKSWLMERDVGERVAEIMAQILRADGLKPGRRKELSAPSKPRKT
jgi:hypothetical protein